MHQLDYLEKKFYGLYNLIEEYEVKKNTIHPLVKLGLVSNFFF